MRLIVLSLLLVMVACGEATTATTSPPTSVAATTTVAPPTTTAPSEDPGLFPPDPGEGSEGAAGSGCMPGPGELPDGEWFGYAVEIEADSIRFDLACFYFGDIAQEKAEEAGQEAPNDFFIINDNPELRTVEVSGDTPAWSITGDPTEGLEQLSFEEWPLDQPTYTPCPGEFCSVWLEIEDGRVVQIVEQYLP